MQKRRYGFSEATVGRIIAMILLLACVGVYIGGKTAVMPEPVLSSKIQIGEEVRSFAAENEDLLRQAMAALRSGDQDALNRFFDETPVNDLYLEDFHDGVQLWSFELDSTSGSALGGCYYDLFYCKTNPRDKIYDWFGDRSGMWEDMGIAQRYMHNGNEIYLEKLENGFWFGYCYC